MSLEDIIAHGNRGANFVPNNKIRCADGFRVSVIAGAGTYCEPRPAMHGFAPRRNEVPESYSGPFTAVEVGFPSSRPEPWDEWRKYNGDADEPIDDVYARVPVELVRELIAAHGGEVSAS